MVVDSVAGNDSDGNENDDSCDGWGDWSGSDEGSDKIVDFLGSSPI